MRKPTIGDRIAYALITTLIALVLLGGARLFYGTSGSTAPPHPDITREP